ncbi:flavin-dependent oxidoreductase [Novosphingobium sp. JCM 18896]|uniref:flavin-dependent oxidoreductase n=1 Tax=Novosphingobium sp. JCM 18896 TaxID=2989731 RepID=UPI00222396B4|nr:flavin-dependent oxidoreductase [Novosphingobium sp. JCM 18896]MCW1428666.1 flavin-dependent oxidoreductase [Novosphingobium sp. JCM 18896]
MDIAIVGGGIVGLTAALSLHAAGFRPTVYEAVAELRPLGVGINLLPHAVRELAELGLLDELTEIGVAIEGLDYHMADGRAVWSEARGLPAGYRWPQVAIHRGALQLFLRDKVVERLGSQAIRTGQPLERFAEEVEDVRLDFRGGGQVRADVAIGADGIHSVVRRQLYPHEGRPKWNGVSLFRGTTRLPAGRFGPRMLWVGHADQKFIAYPIRREGETILLNWVCDLRTGEPGAEPFEDWNRAADKAMLLPRFAGWAWEGTDVPAILAASGEVFEFPMVDRDPRPRWSFGRVTLAGDAAHPMYPIGSNGATQGIIDARALAWHLAKGADPAAGLAAYEAARREPTSRIVLGNRAQGPDKVLELARQRAADPAADLGALLPVDERAAISADYKRLAGFDPELLNARESWSV